MPFLLRVYNGQLQIADNVLLLPNTAITNTLTQKLTTTAISSIRACYSFKLCFSSYVGALVNIRRASDNATSDFYSDTAGNMGQSLYGKGVSLTSWLASTTGYVTKWYDQTGNGYHLIQNTTGNQPQVITNDAGGICLYLSNGITNQLVMSSPNIWGGSTTSVSNAHVIFVMKEIVRQSCVGFSLNNSNNAFWLHSPWSDGTFYFDSGVRTQQAGPSATGTKVYFSGYKDSTANITGFKINGTAVETTNATATVDGTLTLNYGGFFCNLYTYSFVLLNKSFRNTADETALLSYF
jgi:hypothetical protein